MFRLQATQNSMLQFQKLNPDVTAYHRSAAIEMSGNLDISSLKTAIWYLLDRHEALRSKINDQEPAAFLKPISTAELPHSPSWPLKIIDATSLPASPLEDIPATLEKLGESAFLTDQFDLQHGPLWRLALIKFAENKFQLVTLYHHIIVDESSIAILFHDMTIAYNALITQTPIINQPLKSLASYPTELSKNEKVKRISYWKDKLKSLNNLNLQSDFPEQKSFKFSGKRIAFNLDKPLTDKLEKLSKTNNISLNTTLLGCLYSLLYRYSGEEDICIGITSANRRQKDIPDVEMQRLVNCFFNSVPIRLHFSKNSHFTDITTIISNTVKEGLMNQIPLDSLFLEALNNTTKSSFNTASPFNVLFVLNKKKAPIEFQNLQVSEPIELDLGHAKFPYFGINLDEQEDGTYHCFIEYNTALFHEKTIKRLINHFKNTMNYIADNPNCNISTIPILLEEEKVALSQFNHIEYPVYSEFTHDIFHQYAQESPDLIAAVYHAENGEKHTITYGELDKITNQLSNRLREISKDKNKTIGISITRSINLLIGIIASWKAGLIIVPMETLPGEPLFHKMNHTDTSLIIVDNVTKPIFNSSDITTINLDDKDTLQLEEADANYHAPTITANSLAYIVYTSGTTGKAPKGPELTHNGLVNLLHALAKEKIAAHSKVICTSLPTFDAFFFDLLVAIATKGQIHLSYEEGRFIPSILEKIINDEYINYGVFLPDLFSKLPFCPSLNHLVIMGAVASKETLSKWMTANPNIKIDIGYGLTETGICLTLQPYHPDSDPTIIGKPIQHMAMFILNPDDYSECPIGIPGEIYVCGPGVAKGYIKDDAQTKERFIDLAFDPNERIFLKPTAKTSHLPQVRLYATGDNACYWPFNNELAIKFIGRKDRQVKIDGVRLDLNAVETILREHPAIQDIVILPNESVTALRAYVVPRNNTLTQKNLTSEIRKYLANTPLPPVAYPRGTMLLEKLPITSNGKIDIKSLPEIHSKIIPDTQFDNLSPNHIALREIWATVLNCPKEEIGLDDSFNELGGNSLTRSNLVWAVNHSEKFMLSKEIPPSVFLDKNLTIHILEEIISSYRVPPNRLVDVPYTTTSQRRYANFFTHSEASADRSQLSSNNTITPNGDQNKNW